MQCGPPAAPNDRGFTLIEVLVVLMIIGLFVGLVSAITRPDDRAVLRLEAERLSQLLDFAAAEAQLTGKSIAWTADESGARALIRLNRYEEAVAKLVSMPDLYPRDPRNPLALLQAAGIAAERLNDRPRAADLLDQLAVRYPRSPLAPKAQEEAARLRGK
jgi:type II secretion system protein H